MTHDLVHLGLPWWDKALRTLVVYLAILLLLRLAGKRALAQLNSFDLVVLLLLSNVVQNAIIGNETSLPGGLLGAAILLCANYAIVQLTFRHRRLNRLLQGASTPLFEDGHVRERNLRHELMTREEFIAALRRQGMELDDVERVDLERSTRNPSRGRGSTRSSAALERIERKLG